MAKKKDRTYTEATAKSREKFKEEVRGSKGYWTGFIIMIIGLLLSLTGIGAFFGLPLAILGILIMIITKIRISRRKVF